MATSSSLGDDFPRLLLIGKTGSGKSKTGNTILGRDAFVASDSGESATVNASSKYGVAQGKLVNVVDGPGLFDTRKDAQGHMRKAEEALSSVFSRCSEGFHALILVLRYGEKYTPEAEKTLNILRSMFGPSFLRDFGIVLFTHGDEFNLNANEGPERTFEDWCSEQTGDLKKLMDECKHRVILFDNVSPEKRDEQVSKLLSLVNGINKLYTDEMFKKINVSRRNARLTMNAIQLDEEIQRDVCLLNAMLKPDAGDLDKDLLESLLLRLENALQKEDDKSHSVQILKKGIVLAKNKEYPKAHECFEKIENEGEKILEEFSRAFGFMIVLQHMMSFGHAVGFVHRC